ncbi:MAG: ROK family protein [Hyphomicrobium sp.]|nr:ROK family protein [Hyphomicrobium sp.]
MSAWRIVCDVGGTYVRTARCAEAYVYTDVVVRSTKDCESLAAWLRAYARSFADFDELAGVAVAAAGPVEDGEVQLTNAPLAIHEALLRDGFGGGQAVRVINDLEAVAWSIPELIESQTAAVRTPSNALGGNLLVVNVGTGFGAAMLVKTPDGWQSVGCEPGHMKLTSCLTAARPDDGECSIEDVLSGVALRDAATLAWFAEPGAAVTIKEDSADQFADLAQSPAGRQIISRINSLLGQVCGDLVLACGAWGGVYICGGVAAALRKQADPADFIAAFDAKGPMSPRMARVNVYYITEPNPALIGLCALPL